MNNNISSKFSIPISTILHPLTPLILLLDSRMKGFVEHLKQRESGVGGGVANGTAEEANSSLLSIHEI
jgi:hypothetical protein